MRPAPSLDLPALLLEENLRVRGIIVEALRARGHAITICEDAETAWEAYQLEHHPLVLVDVQANPTANGEFLKKIRTLPQGKVSVLLAIAGRHAPQHLLPLLESADDVVFRPFKAESVGLRLATAERLAWERAERSAVEADRAHLLERLEKEQKKATSTPPATLPHNADVTAAVGGVQEPTGLRGKVRRMFGAKGATHAQPGPPADGAKAPVEGDAALTAATLPSPPTEGGANQPDDSAPVPLHSPTGVEGQRVATLEWDLKTGEIHFSREWKDLFGYRPREVGTSPDEWFGRVHPEDLDQLKAAIAAHLEGGTPAIENRHRIARSDGAYELVVFRGVATRDGTGIAHRVAGSHADVAGTRGFDSLTGLPNRNNLMDRLGRALERNRAGDGRLTAVLFLDLDRFKNINYSLGHVVGDQMLKAVADRLRTCLPNGDMPGAVRATISHVGGDEFAILLEGINDVNDAVRIAKRIQDALQEPFDVEGHEVFTSTSIGIAVGTPDYQRAEDLLRDADTAMFRAKALGKAGHVVFDSGMHARAVSLLKLETELRRAVQREEFRVYYQPIVELDTGRITGFEALVRWQHPDGELLLPKEFLAVAEETGLIISIDRGVVRDVCKQLRAWNAQFRRNTPLTVSVNVSGVQFMRPDMIVEIDRTLRNHGVYGRSLKLEITESVIMEHARYAADMLQQLKTLDIKLSIDDFGTGYSSLSYLRRFEIDTLKVDMSFVSRIDTDEESWEIIRTIVTLGNNLGKDVVAEGIERGKQRELLMALRCKYGQGYFFSRPVPAEAATALLAADARGETLLKT